MSAATIEPASGLLTPADRWDHILARWGVNRMGHRVAPGLYALGSPTPDSPVFVTANYTLSFDALRANLARRPAWLLVLDTQGINVWCAAGKGTFGTDELVRRIEATRLGEVVRHRRLILPQLGAPGVSAHAVLKRSGFRVEYGPVRAVDLPAYLSTGRATPEMRRVTFGLWDRVVLIPVELVHVLPILLLAAFVLHNRGLAAAIVAGTVLFPLLLPWLPTRDFSSKGFLLGLLVAVPFALARFTGTLSVPWWHPVGRALADLLQLPPVVTYLALNFTGATPLTSRTGVRREIFTYVPPMVWSFGLGLVLSIVFSLLKGV